MSVVLSHSRLFRSNGDVTNSGEDLQFTRLYRQEGVPRIYSPRTGVCAQNKAALGSLEIENLFECVFLVNILIDLIIRSNYELLQIVRMWNLKPITFTRNTIPYKTPPSWKIYIYYLQTCFMTKKAYSLVLTLYVVNKSENRHGSSSVCDKPNSLKQVIIAPLPNPG